MVIVKKKIKIKKIKRTNNVKELIKITIVVGFMQVDNTILVPTISVFYLKFSLDVDMNFKLL